MIPLLHRLLVFSCIAACTPGGLGAATPEPEIFGRTAEGQVVRAFRLTNRHGTSARIIEYGAALADLQVADREGRVSSVVHAASDPEATLRGNFDYLGVVHGRFANRIARGKFTLDGKTYQLAMNGRDNVHHLHGGERGFARLVWSGRYVDESAGQAAELTLISPDGDEGYPGRLVTVVRYTLTDTDVLRIDYSATTDRATPINLTHHAFFDLSSDGVVGDQKLELAADRITVFDERQMPTGEMQSVAGTPFDFRTARVLAEQAAGLPLAPRYNQNFVLRRPEGSTELLFAARLEAPRAGRTLEVWTTEPGFQLFTSFLGPVSGEPRREGRRRRGFVCLETQHFPDSVNHPHFPSTILRPGETFRSTTEFRFSVDQAPAASASAKPATSTDRP